MTLPPLDLADGFRLAGLSYSELWTRCLALGDSGTLDDIRAHIDSAECPDDYQHNVIAQALNDAFTEQGRDHPVMYQHLHAPRPTQAIDGAEPAITPRR